MSKRNSDRIVHNRGSQYPFVKLCARKKKEAHAFKRKAKAELKRRWHQEVESMLQDRENTEPQTAQ